MSPEQVRQLIAGLREQPDLLDSFKKALGLEGKKSYIHPKTVSRLDKFSGADGQWQEWIFNFIMTFKARQEARRSHGKDYHAMQRDVDTGNCRRDSGR